MIIAIDGPAASGKGTIARRLAKHYGLPHLDTGLLYRAVAKAVLDAGYKLEDRTHVIEAALAVDPSQFDEAQPHRGWFDWQGQHRFAEGQVYGLHLEDGRAYDIQITDVSGPRIKFEAIG